MSSGDFLSDRELAENRLIDLLVPSDYLPQADCEIGAVYWGASRSIGGVAICRPTISGLGVGFEGLRNKLGVDFLFTEHHYDADEMFGTFKPFLKIAEAASDMTESQKMTFLLDKEIEVQKLKLDWLENVPGDLQAVTKYFYDDTLELLQYLIKLKRNGFSDHSTLSFQSIMEQGGETK